MIFLVLAVYLIALSKLWVCSCCFRCACVFLVHLMGKYLIWLIEHQSDFLSIRIVFWPLLVMLSFCHLPANVYITVGVVNSKREQNQCHFLALHLSSISVCGVSSNWKLDTRGSESYFVNKVIDHKICYDSKFRSNLGFLLIWLFGCCSHDLLLLLHILWHSKH